MNWEVILWTSVTIGVLLCVAALIVTIISARNMKKSRDSMQVLQEQIKVGAKIMFGGGIFGTIVKINDDKIDVEISKGVVITIYAMLFKVFADFNNHQHHHLNGFYVMQVLFHEHNHSVKSENIF